MRPNLLWLAAVAAMVVGTALVFASVTTGGLFTPGVALIDVALLLAAAAAALQLRPHVTDPAAARD